MTKTPSLYNVIYNGERIPLFLAAGEKLSLNSVGSVVRNYTVEGSKESELLRQFYQAFVTGAQQLENMGTEFARKLTDEERKSLPERRKVFGDAILSFTTIGLERTMNFFNKK